MIPTVILWGLIFGRWWKTALIGSAIAWPAVLAIDGVMGLEPGQLLAAALLAVANATVGAAVHQGVLWLVRRVRRNGAPVPS